MLICTWKGVKEEALDLFIFQKSQIEVTTVSPQHFLEHFPLNFADIGFPSDFAEKVARYRSLFLNPVAYPIQRILLNEFLLLFSKHSVCINSKEWKFRLVWSNLMTLFSNFSGFPMNLILSTLLLVDCKQKLHPYLPSVGLLNSFNETFHELFGLKLKNLTIERSSP